MFLKIAADYFVRLYLPLVSPRDSIGGRLRCVGSHLVLRSPLFLLSRTFLPSLQITVYFVRRRWPRVRCILLRYFWQIAQSLAFLGDVLFRGVMYSAA